MYMTLRKFRCSYVVRKELFTFLKAPSRLSQSISSISTESLWIGRFDSSGGLLATRTIYLYEAGEDPSSIA